MLGRFHSEFYPLIRDTGAQSFKKSGENFRQASKGAKVRQIPDGPIGAVWFRRGRIHSQAVPTDFSEGFPLTERSLTTSEWESKHYFILMWE
jgi:hypothetical protein